MKTRLTVLLAAIFFTAAAVSAQDSGSEGTAKTYKTVIWGIKGNIGAELPHANWIKDGDKTRMFNSGFGASIGGLANIFLGNNFYFEPELALYYEGYSYNNVLQVAPNSPSVNAGPNVYKLGFRVPLVFGYYINITDTWGLDVFTGPQFSYAFYGTNKTENKEVKDDYDLMHLFKGEYAQRRWDVGWKVGIGFPVSDFLISIEGDLGITNLLKQRGVLRENRVSLGITYYFTE